MLTSLINFPARQEISALKNMDTGKVKAMVFYQDMLLGKYWGWMSNLEAHVKKGKSAQPSPLVMGGNWTALEVGPKPDGYYIDVVFYRQRAQHSGYGYHNPREFMDKCLH